MKWLRAHRARASPWRSSPAPAPWLLGTESGLRWALGFAPRELAVEGARGALAREIAVRARRL